jgi:hypothetical protein
MSSHRRCTVDDAPEVITPDAHPDSAPARVLPGGIYSSTTW